MSKVATRPKPSPSQLSRLDFSPMSFGCADGYGNSAEQMALALERAGVAVQLRGMVRPIGAITAHDIWNRTLSPEAPAIVFYTQPTGWLPGLGRKSIGFSMYETDDLPAKWNDRIRCVDEVWVPSSWLVEPFAERSGRPAHVIPLGVNGERFPYRKRERGAKLRFLHFSTANADGRKGADLAMRAFALAFPLTTREDAELIIHSSAPPVAMSTDRRVRGQGGYLMPHALTALYHSCDALLYPSRGEGAGLVPLEAMATGMPAIIPAATGMADYADLGLSVAAERILAPPQYGGHWYEPRLDELVARLREVDTDYDAVMQRAAESAATIRTQWTWDRTAAAMLERLST